MRDPRRTILIVVGADKTEVAYLKGLRNALRAATVALTITAKPGAPDQLVAYARDSCSRDDFGEVWCAAMDRARLLEPTGKDHGRNPSTNVWRVVQSILESA